ncbi:MAG TPA: hypothetical protein VF297_25150 [Pyrinomonadaceae bacterium]
MSKRLRPSYPCGNFLKLCLLLTAAACAACAGSARRQSSREAPPAPRQPQAAAATPARAEPVAHPAAAPTPRLEEVQGALARVYRDAVTVRASGGTPFVVGDFNGDDSQDIAVVVTPARGKLPRLNSEYASWLVGDPRKVVPPEVRGDVKVFPKKPEPVVVREDDVLLAVIHGYQKEGWRNQLSAQTFLLRNAVGAEMIPLKARSAAHAADEKGKLPQLRGDVIWETLAGAPGFIYWTGARYAWFDPSDRQQRQAP